MMAERGVVVSHTTILRWVLRYVPEFEERWARYKRPVQPSWRIDETAVPVRGGRHYLYRAVDKHGMTVNSLLCTGRSVFSAEEFFRLTVARNQCWPRKCQSRRQRREPSSVAAALQAGSEMAIRHRSLSPLSQQHSRAGPQGDQTPLRSYAGAQVLPDGKHHSRWYRTGASHSKTAVLDLRRQPAEDPFIETSLGASASEPMRRQSRSAAHLPWGLTANAPELRETQDDRIAGSDD